MSRRTCEASGWRAGKTALPDYILTLLGDRMEMAHSIEGRVPFLDHTSASSWGVCRCT